MQQLIDKHLLTTVRLVLLLSSLYIWGHWDTEIWLRLSPCGHSNPVGQVPKPWSQPLYYCLSLTCWVSGSCCQSEISVSLCTPLTWSGCGSYPWARGTSSWGSALCPALEELSVPSETMFLCLKPPSPFQGTWAIGNLPESRKKVPRIRAHIVKPVSTRDPKFLFRIFRFHIDFNMIKSFHS